VNAIEAAAPREPVSVKVAGVATPAALAVIVLLPAVAPVVSVHWARPELLVEVVQLERDPPPAVTAQVTVTPDTRFEFVSFTTAISVPGSGAPAVPVCPPPDETAMLVAAPAVVVSVNVAGVATPETVAVAVFVPTVVPVVKLHWTCPEPLVEVVQLESDPPPAVTAHVTVTPEMMLEFESFTIAIKDPERGEPAVPVCPPPDDTLILAAAPTVVVWVNVAGAPIPETEAVTVLVPTVVPVVKLHWTCPKPLVVVVQLETAPPPAVTAQVTVTPETTFEFESFTTATKGEESAAPATADCPPPDETEMLAAVPAVAVSVNVAGVEIPETEAVTVFVPAMVPVVNRHWVCPEMFVVVAQLESAPPPAVAAHATVTPETALEFASFTTAMRVPERRDPAVPDCPLPDRTAMLAAAPAVVVSVNVAGVETPATLAVIVFVPTEGPVVSVHCESPDPFVVLQLETDPPPAVTVQLTEAPATGFEFESVTKATRGDETAEPAVAVCPLPDKTAILAAVPKDPLSVNAAGVATPATDAVMVLVPAVIPVVKLHWACPAPFVVAEQLETDPPPVVTNHETVTPGVGLESESVTTAMRGEETAEPAVALCPLPDKTAIFAGEPWVTVTLGKELVTAFPWIVAPIAVALPLTSPVKVAV
jgi:hypothetical protein